MRTNLVVFVVALVVAVGLLASPAHAAIYTWNAGGGNTNWATAANWGGTEPGSGDTADFSGSTGRTVTIDNSNPTVATVNVTGSAQWIFASGGTLTVTTAFNYSDTYVPAYGNAPASSGGKVRTIPVASTPPWPAPCR